MNRKRYKLMAFVLSTGLWDGLGCIALEQVLGFVDHDLKEALANWQAEYDDQFMRHPHSFDWESFNDRGAQLAVRIRDKLPPGADVYYEPSDDREFFSPEKCQPADKYSKDTILHELALRDRKRTLLHTGLRPS